jgi:hypothetical protein
MPVCPSVIDDVETWEPTMKRFLVLLSVSSVCVYAVATSAQAAVTTNTAVQIDSLVLVPCTGDLVELQGPLHMVSSVTVNGNRISGQVLTQPAGVSGSDLTTGAAYRGTGETAFRFSDDLRNGQAVETFVNNFKIIGAGNTPNYLVHENSHVTISADGSVTAVVDNLSITCG